jgi:AraC-like DNA-binding protein
MFNYRLFQFGPVDIYEVKSDYVLHKEDNFHCHKEYEIFYLINGESERTVEGHKFLLASDSFLLIPSNSFHQWKYPVGKMHHHLSLHFLPEILSKTEQKYFGDLFVEPLSFMNGAKNHLNFYFQSIIECKEMDESMQKPAVKYRVLSLLTQLKFLKTGHASKPVILDERIQKMLVYFSEHLTEDICLDEIAKKFAVSKNHLNNHFHRIVGTSIIKYITVKRLEFVRQKVLEGIRIGEAAFMAGFKDYPTFFRAYKSHYGCSPSETLVNQVEYIK